MSAIVDTIEKYGGDPNSVVRLDANSAELLPYATLLTARAVGSDLASLCAVYEWQQRPLLFVIDGELLPDGNASIGRIRRVLAMRGDAPYLAVVNGGSMTVYQIGLDADTPSRARLPKKALPQSDAATIPHLGNLRPAVAKSRWISDVILRLLSDAIDTLIGHGIDDQEAISLVGRALFVRFLADRSLLPPSGVPDTQGGADALFDNRRNARATSDWLDDTFNGDFLRL